MDLRAITTWVRDTAPVITTAAVRGYGVTFTLRFVPTKITDPANYVGLSVADVRMSKEDVERLRLECEAALRFADEHEGVEAE